MKIKGLFLSDFKGDAWPLYSIDYVKVTKESHKEKALIRFIDHTINQQNKNTWENISRKYSNFPIIAMNFLLLKFMFEDYFIKIYLVLFFSYM